MAQQKSDLCYIKSLFQFYLLSFLNKKLAEVLFIFLINLKLTRRWGAATRVFIRMHHFFKMVVIKPEELWSTFQKKQEKWIYLCKNCYYINFL